MAKTIVPINNLDKVGMVKDTPAVALGPNGFTDALNVRFSNGCVSKLPGEQDIIPATVLEAFNNNLGVGDIVHMAYWANPNLAPNGYYIIVGRKVDTDRVYAINPVTYEIEDLDIEFPSAGARWQHTFFQGGYAVILNNGVARPHYILDKTGNLDITKLKMYELPGWDSYFTSEESINDVFDSNIMFADFDLGREVDFSAEEVYVNVLAADGSRKFSQILKSTTTKQQCTLSLDVDTGSHVVAIATAAGGVGQDAFSVFLEDGDQVIVNIKSIATVQVRAGVIRAWNDTLVAGDLIEIFAPAVASVSQVDSKITFTEDAGLKVGDFIRLTIPFKGKVEVTAVVGNEITVSPALPVADYSVTRYSILSSGKAIRNQTGVIRISDAAAPGSIPNNWNPYGVGVSTADEFQLSTTGIIQEIAELQGNLYVYTNHSVHSISRTGNFQIPYISNVVSTSYGALGLDCVLEYNGVHIVVGPDDVYQFGGHPASIQSIALGRVKAYMFRKIFEQHAQDTKIIANRSDNEVWISYFTDAGRQIRETLIWSLENNAWSRRVMSPFECIIEAPTRIWNESAKQLEPEIDNSRTRPVMASLNEIFATDFDLVYRKRNGSKYTSSVERIEAPLTPEFDVEYISSMALWINKDNRIAAPFDVNVTLGTVDVLSTNPSWSDMETAGKTGQFTLGEDYKIDVRSNGRFMNFKIDDKSTFDRNWILSGIQLELGKGGAR